MRLRNYIIFGLAVLLSAACSDDRKVVSLAHQISCKPARAKITRASSSVEDLFPSAQDLTVWCAALPKGHYWSLEADKAEMLVKGETFRCNPVDSLWYGTSGQEWDSEKALTFFSVSPPCENATFSRENGIVVKDFHISEDAQLLYNRPVQDIVLSTAGSYVPVLMQNALSKVDIYVSTVDADIYYRVYAIRIKDIVESASFSTGTGKWSDGKGTTDLPMYSSEEGQIVPTQYTVQFVSFPAYTIPTVVNKAYFEIEYDEIDAATDDATRHIGRSPIIKTSWEPGRHYTYNLRLRPEEYGLSFVELSLDDIINSMPDNNIND